MYIIVQYTVSIHTCTTTTGVQPWRHFVRPALSFLPARGAGCCKVLMLNYALPNRTTQPCSHCKHMAQSQRNIVSRGADIISPGI